MNIELDELKTLADELGITYPKNIGVAKLQEKIDAENQTADDSVEVPAVEVEPVLEKLVEATIKETPDEKFRRQSAERRIAAKKTRVVTITNLDKRDNDKTTSAWLSAGDLAYPVPLDVAVELPIALITVAKNLKIMNHVDDGSGTGNKMNKWMNKYAVNVGATNTM